MTGICRNSTVEFYSRILRNKVLQFGPGFFYVFVPLEGGGPFGHHAAHSRNVRQERIGGLQLREYRVDWPLQLSGTCNVPNGYRS